MEGQLRTQAASCEEAGEEAEATKWKGTLARVLGDQGRNEEALAMQESVLEFRRRVLPAEHPDIGEGRVWSAAACAFFADCDGMGCRLTRRIGHEPSCCDVLQPRKAERSACDAGKGGGVQSSCAA